MAQQSWFSSRFLSFLQPRIERIGRKRWARVSPEQWMRLARASRRGRNLSRRSRRFHVVCYIALISFFAPIDSWLTWAHAGRLKAPDAQSLALLVPFLLACIVLRQMRRKLSGSTLDDYAIMSHGSSFLTLEEGQRALVLLEWGRDEGQLQDEREANLRLRSKAVAYRILRPCLILAVAAYWIVFCRLPIHANSQALFRITVDVAIWLASFAIVLPLMVHMWTQPDNLDEPTLAVGAEKEI